MSDNLPNFLVVGAAKSGTSSLHNYLNQHPEIFMPSFRDGVNVKEPQFFGPILRVFWLKMEGKTNTCGTRP